MCFGLFKRGENVYPQVVSNCFVKELYPIIASKVSPDSTIYTDGFKTYDGLVDFGYQNTSESNMKTMSLRMVTITLMALKTLVMG